MRWAFIIEICYYPVRASARRLRPDAAGVGLCVLPCFIGDDDGRLVRASAPIPELSHDQWLVSHDDDRHAPAIRRTANRLAKLFRGHKTLFAGEEARAP